MTYQPLRQANPVPHEDSLPTGMWESSVLLDVIDERNNWMDTQQRTPIQEPDRKTRGWTVALLAAAAVIVVGLGTALLTGSGEDDQAPAADNTPVTVTTIESAPPTKASSPTTEAPKTSTTVATGNALSTEDQELLENMVGAFNARNEAEFRTYFTPDAPVTNDISADTDISGFIKELPWRWAMNEHWEIVECNQFSTISCRVRARADSADFQFRAPVATIRITSERGLIAEFRMTEEMAIIGPTIQGFYDWLEENHPQELAQMRVPPFNPGAPALDQQSIELWLELLPIYKSEAGF